MSRKTLLIAFTVSLILNIGFIGYWVGKTAISKSYAPAAFTRTGPSIERLLKPLGEERVEALRPVTQAYQPRTREHFEKIREAQHEIYNAMVEDPFDAERLQNAQRNFNQLFIDAKARHDQLWLTLAEHLTAEERRQILKASMPQRHAEGRRGSIQKVRKKDE